jgi:multidrug resistance efflux pump
MHRRLSTILLLASAISAACAATTGGSGPGAPPASPASQATANEWDGTAVPPDGTAIAIWPEAYAGELIVLDVLPHGSLVKQGDVIAHLELRPIDDQIRQSELEAHSALVRTSNVEEKNRIDAEAAASALETARAALDRSRRALEGWEKFELQFAKRGAELEDRHRLAGIEDQTDELAQLEKMYKADELVDATEEIVIKRAKRALDLSKLGLALAREQRAYREKYDETLQTEAKREAVHVQEGSLERLTQSQVVDKRAADDGLERSKAQLADQQKKLEELRRDRELLTIHAPRAGLLLHGSLDDYRPHQVPPRHERGSRLTPRKELFTISDPEKLVIAVDVPESKLEAARPGSRVEVHPVFDPAATVAGKLEVAEYPEAKSATAAENNYRASVVPEHALPGLRVGMRAKVKLAPESSVGEPKAAGDGGSSPGGSTSSSASPRSTSTGSTNSGAGVPSS